LNCPVAAIVFLFLARDFPIIDRKIFLDIVPPQIGQRVFGRHRFGGLGRDWRAIRIGVPANQSTTVIAGIYGGSGFASATYPVMSKNSNSLAK
jgi:hypothetical protein